MYTIDCNHSPKLWCVKYNNSPCYFASTATNTEEQMQALIISPQFLERMAAQRSLYTGKTAEDFA